MKHRRLFHRLAALQAEAEQIRQAIGDGTTVVVQLQIGEVSLTKLRGMGLDPVKFLVIPM